MKNSIISKLLLLTMLAGMTGCTDFLTEKSETDFTTQTLFETSEGLEKMVVALYPYERGLVGRDGKGGFMGAHLWVERTTDIVMFTGGDDANLSRYTDPTPSGSINELLYNPFWTAKYYTIGRANEIIHYGQLLGDQTKATVAEASFWRAYSYYGLWARFSRCYLSTEPVTKESMESLTYTPADSIDVFKVMYDDAERAIIGLPDKVSEGNEGRVARPAARHLKALIAAWAKDWAEVAKQVDAIEAEYGANGLAMIPDPATIFNKADLCNTTETLFGLNFANERGGGSGNRTGSQYTNLMADIDYTYQMVNNVLVRYNELNFGKQWGLAFPNSYLLSLYPENDKRLDAYYKRHYTYQNPNKLITVPVSEEKTIDGVTFNTTTNFTGTPREVKIGDVIYGRDLNAATKSVPDRRKMLPTCLKTVDLWTRASLSGDNSFKDFIIYRLSESFLLGAEAYMHLGNQSKAKYYYNKTWMRAGNQEETRTVTFDMLRDEQARELAFEGRRFDFLKRNSIWYNQMRSYSGDFTKAPGSTVAYDVSTYGVTDGRDKKFGPNAAYYADFAGNDNDVYVRYNVKPIHVNWPIPQTQIDAMGPSFPQTDGYK